MAATNLENQLHSAQKNVLFLQREHASTLKGLHAEIRRLQQHCTDLTYELTLKSSEETGKNFLPTSQRRCVSCGAYVGTPCFPEKTHLL